MRKRCSRAPGSRSSSRWGRRAVGSRRSTRATTRRPVEPQRTNGGRRLAYHDSCHMLRELHVADAPRGLLERSGAELVPLPRPDLCCGFGGTFSVRQPEVSVAMADDKLAAATEADALVTADPGCLMHLRARAERAGSPVRVVHLATAL